MNDQPRDDCAAAVAAEDWARGFYEPWVPEIGDQVQFRQNLECPLENGVAQDGAIGTVYWREDPVSQNGRDLAHRFWVDWGEGRTTYTAACELIPLAEAR